MIPRLSAEQRRAAEELGVPMPLYDPQSKSGYVLLPARIAYDSAGGVLASVPVSRATGSGSTPEEALLALSVLLRGSLRREGAL